VSGSTPTSPSSVAAQIRCELAILQGALTQGEATHSAVTATECESREPMEPLNPDPFGRDRRLLYVPQEEATPLGLARLFLRQRMLHSGKPALVRWAGQWWVLRDGFHRELKDEQLRAALWPFLETIMVMKDGGDDLKTERFVPTRSSVSEVIEALMAEGCAPRVETEAPVWISGRGELDPEELLVCPNGFVHLPTRMFLPTDPDLFTPYGINVPYVDDAPEPTTWLRFLDDLWGTERDCIETLQTMMGYFLTPDTSQQKIFLFVGPPRSGKGTIMHVVRSLMGKQNIASPTLNQFERPFGLQSLVGKSLAIIGDARLGGRADQAVISERLLSISGEDSIDVDRKHRDLVTLRLKTRLVILSNEMPKLTDASGALASRFVLLTTAKSFLGEEDTGLKRRLEPELPGLLRWAIDGWHRLREQGAFWPPESSTDATVELKEFASPISHFLEDRCRSEDSLEVGIGPLYDAWVAWCKESGRDHPGTRQSFARDLRAVLPRVKTRYHRRPDGTRSRVYYGLGLR